jgi:hypothetical protein
MIAIRKKKKGKRKVNVKISQISQREKQKNNVKAKPIKSSVTV